MDVEKAAPVLVYDNMCHLCTRFARIAGILTRGRITLVGHYSKSGEEIREKYLGPEATEMFWMIDGNNAYGGRSGLIPLLRQILSRGSGKSDMPDVAESCGDGCKSPKAALIRSASIICRSKKIKIGQS